MGRGLALNDKEKGQIMAYKEERLSNREIGRRIGRSVNIVNNFIRLKDEYGKKKAPGKAGILTPRQKRAIRAAAANSTKGSRRLQKELAPNVSHVTVWKALTETFVMKK